jgi:hypothetical protein
MGANYFVQLCEVSTNPCAQFSAATGAYLHVAHSTMQHQPLAEPINSEEKY